MSPQTEPKIIDVRVECDESSAASLRFLVLSGLSQPVGKKTLPTMLLYDERGLRLYDAITTDAEEYYLFPAEEDLLRNRGGDIVRAMHGERGVVDGEVVLELGAGALRKTSHLLLSLASLVQTSTAARDPPPITYYALDLERRELVRTLNQVTMENPDETQSRIDREYGILGTELADRVEVRGMWGTYDDAIHFINDGGFDKMKTAEESNTVEHEDKDREFHHVSTSFGNPSPPSHSSTSDSEIDSRYAESATALTSPWMSSLGSKADSIVLSEASPLHILFLGSTIGNFSRKAMASFLLSLPLRPGSGDTLLLGLDGDNGKELVERAYDDKKGITREFILNGLKGAGRILGDELLFAEGKWKYVSVYNEAERRHEAYYKSVGSQTLKVDAEDGNSNILDFGDGEMINIEYSHKFSPDDVISLVSESNLRIIQKWTDVRGLYSLYLLERPYFHFPLIDERGYVSGGSPFNVPSLAEWGEMWKAWDSITLGMIPYSMLHEKPIHLRHKCLFYLGHIPTFLDIHLSGLLGESHTKPQEYKYIFERGIDPQVDDPTQCSHPHSKVPEDDSEWPTLDEILDYRDRVRERLSNLYVDIESGKYTMNRRIARVLFMTFEHEGLHAETLLYMLIQRAGSGTFSPPHFRAPSFEALSFDWNAEYAALSASSRDPVVKLGPQTITLGHDDLEADDLVVPLSSSHSFGWDNESPKRIIEVAEFKISWRPVTNGEFYAYWSNAKANDGGAKVTMPASWVEFDDALCVRTLYGPVKFQYAQHWPVLTSYYDLSTYARIKGGRIPTLSELRTFYETFQTGFVGGGNIGFRNWHPVPATTGGPNGGRGHNGGIWEWTSTKLDKYEGFVPSKLYPGYSMDFFDQQHQVVIGGSYATIPRIAQRNTVCNFYQHNYPFAWVGARIVYDV